MNVGEQHLRHHQLLLHDVGPGSVHLHLLQVSIFVMIDQLTDCPIDQLTDCLFDQLTDCLFDQLTDCQIN